MPLSSVVDHTPKNVRAGDLNWNLGNLNRLENNIFDHFQFVRQFIPAER